MNARSRSRTAPSPTGAGGGVSLREFLIAAGLQPESAAILEQVPYRLVQVEPRRSFREAGAPRAELIFVRSGLISKYKVDASGRRQIVALRFPGEVIFPREVSANYGIQAIVKSEVMISKGEGFSHKISKHPDLQRFLWKLAQRDEAIGYEWMVNCGRRDSIARVAHLLCETAVRSGVDLSEHPLHNPFNQQQIADITGQTSVNVNRVFADLERQALIKRSGREIRFLDWEELRRISSFDPSYLD